MEHNEEMQRRLDRVDRELSEAKGVAEIGESLYQEMFEKGVLGKSGFVAIHTASKQYITGATRVEVSKRYEERFGNDPCYLRMIGGLEYAGNIEFRAQRAR